MIVPKPCPLCGSEQVQYCSDGNNPAKDYCRCRACKTTGPLMLWQARPAAQDVLDAARNLIRVKGRHHSELAYQRLVAAVEGAAP